MVTDFLYKAIEEVNDYDKFLMIFDKLAKKKININIAYKIAIFLAR